MRARSESGSLYDRAVQRRNADFAEESNEDFVAQCGIQDNAALAVRALKIRELVAGLVAVGRPEQVLATYRLETDLGLSAMDSLNICDLALDVEKELGASLDDESMGRLAELNRQDAEVRELVRFILGLPV